MQALASESGHRMTPAPLSALAPIPLRARVRTFIEHARTQQVIIALILVNAAILGLETSDAVMAAIGPALIALDRALLTVFVLEIALRLYAHRAAFCRNPWSVFDFVVVAIALIPASGPFAVLRALRVLRVLRLLTMVPSMRRVVGALLAAIPGLGSIAAVLLIVYYVFGVIATKLFADAFPQWFGTLGESLYTLFQVMTLESWSMGIARPVKEQYPYAWAFFVPFILVATFTMLNLFIAIIVNAMQTFATEHEQPTAAAGPLQAELQGLRRELADLRMLLEERRRDR
jgi:voltage-gated sodium channel